MDAKESYEAFHHAFVTALLAREDKLDEVYLKSPNGKAKCTWTRRELADEVSRSTPMGLDMMIGMMNLSAHMISRDRSLNGEER